VRRCAIGLVLVCAACSSRITPFERLHDDGGLVEPPASCPPGASPCRLAGALEIQPDGLSDWFHFVVPPNTRSIGIELIGADASLYALGGLVGPDGRDLVALPAGTDLKAVMQHEFYDLTVGMMPGDLYQTIRLGTFVHDWPYAPAATPDAGLWSLRAATDLPATAPIVAAVTLAPDDGARTLHINLITVTNAAQVPDSMPALAPTQAILAPAGLQLVVDEQHVIQNVPLATLETPLGSYPGPSSDEAMLALLGRPLVKSPALDVFVVDGFTNLSVYGFSLGVPGPDDPASYYYGIFVRYQTDTPSLAHNFAHELSHYLGLQHVENTDGSTTYPDPLPDTDPSLPNLMDFSGNNTLTPDQIWVLQHSPMLEK
jgi:hypothetical protein